MNKVIKKIKTLLKGIKTKLFKSVDDMFSEIGFSKIEENKDYVTYERYVDGFYLIQNITLIKKATGNHVIQSYIHNFYDKIIIDASIQFSIYEIKLCLKKMKEMGWKV